jgi:hypothetical protein
MTTTPASSYCADGEGRAIPLCRVTLRVGLMRRKLLTHPLEPGDAVSLVGDAAPEGGVVAELRMRDRRRAAVVPVQAKKLVTVPGTDHGTALLAGRSAAITVPAILAFLHRVLG